jgi:hypothetical protein
MDYRIEPIGQVSGKDRWKIEFFDEPAYRLIAKKAKRSCFWF